MPEDITPIPLEEPIAAPAASGLKAFLSTTAGKLVVGGAAVGLLVMVGVVVAVVLLLSSAKPEVTVLTPGTPASNATSRSVPGAAETTVVPPAVPDSEVFTFRDVFKPLIVKEAESGPSGTPGSTTTTGTAGDTDTLYLQDLVVADGKDKAVLTYNGTAYTLAEGEAVGETPWKVLSIDASTDSVVMLYGDSQVTLTVGEGTASGK